MKNETYRFNISFLLLNKMPKYTYHCQVFSLTIFFFFLMNTLSFSNQEIPLATIWYKGEQVAFSIKDSRYEQVLTEAIKIAENAVDYHDGFFLKSQLKEMKMEHPSVEIVFQNEISLFLNNIGQNIQLDKLLLISKNDYIKYIFWGTGEYQLDGTVLGSSESSTKILNILESK